MKFTIKNLLYLLILIFLFQNIIQGKPYCKTGYSGLTIEGKITCNDTHYNDTEINIQLCKGYYSPQCEDWGKAFVSGRGTFYSSGFTPVDNSYISYQIKFENKCFPERDGSKKCKFISTIPILESCVKCNRWDTTKCSQNLTMELTDIQYRKYRICE
uniref:Secreted protein n=1 Tax=Parastrongyloides trichosuri TaxID=131310 RepID=A0A0N4Z1G6_PARTI